MAYPSNLSIADGFCYFERLQMLSLVPGVSFFLHDVQLTKQKGFAKFNLVGYYPRKYRGKVELSSWFLLTNLESFSVAVNPLKQRSGVEAMFKNCKTGGYNLESIYATEQQLITLILLIAIAYTIAVLIGRNF